MQELGLNRRLVDLKWMTDEHTEASAVTNTMLGEIEGIISNTSCNDDVTRRLL